MAISVESLPKLLFSTSGNTDPVQRKVTKMQNFHKRIKINDHFKRNKIGYVT